MKKKIKSIGKMGHRVSSPLPTHVNVPVTLMAPVRVNWPENITLRELAKFGWMLGIEFVPTIKKIERPKKKRKTNPQ